MSPFRFMEFFLLLPASVLSVSSAYATFLVIENFRSKLDVHKVEGRMLEVT
ncbi:unnamed protein product [Albugo candida]|uniref:Uncharacterized protein n=1 Tax=Albugo candida TaxID=65357 RepID=A0A024FWM1_9STRA|nr:unnamed protein product [Albugo candida]|eukprot:CCI11436.1 unnamed protein product [Albugo candida]